MIGENIKRFRLEKGLTQKELAEKLFVTAQAVSRWENGEVEPSVSTIAEMAKIFNVSSDEILGVGGFNQRQEVKIEKEYVYQDPVKPVLGVCEICNKPIYEPNDIVRINQGGRHPSTHLFCSSCNKKIIEEKKQGIIINTRKNRIKSYVWGGISAGGLFLSTFAVAITEKDYSSTSFWLIISISLFTFTSCCLLRNNFIGGMTMDIFTFGFLKLPGLIFELSLDGILWLLTVKLLLWILNIFLAIGFGILAIIIGLALSIVVYPFALYKSYNHPELSE
ncbi:MAG: helix-turn-helix domain-containing protein [Bacilli bacterium]